MGTKKKFAKLFELAELLGGEVGATRPVVYADWADHDALVGQPEAIKPQILFSFGISGAIQHTAACNGAKFVIAVNKNPNATMMKMAMSPSLPMRAAQPALTRAEAPDRS